MDDALAPTDDPFAQLDPEKAAPIGAAPAAQPSPDDGHGAPVAEPAPPAAQDNEPDPFAELGPVGSGESTAFGAFRRGAGRGVAPALTGFAAMGAGAELGAIVGTAAGPGWGNLAGGIAGGLVGGIAGGYLGSTAQDWVLSKLPDSFVDALGQSDRQRKLDEAQHSTASFLGGMTPYAVTMRPGIAPLANLPENATALQRIMANKATAVAFGGAVNGGMELGQEAVHGEVDWQKVGIATVFGMVYNQPTKIGQAITEAGARPVRAVAGIPHPTVAQAGDLKVMGPGVTEEVFHGTQEQAPSAALTAQEAARQEHMALAEQPEPNLQDIARRMEPELFSKMEALELRRDTLARWSEETQLPSVAQHLASVQAEIAGLQPEIGAAYRRAADTTGTGIVEPEQFPSFAAMLAAHEHGGGNVPSQNVRPVQEEQALGSTEVVPGVPGVQPAGENAAPGPNDNAARPQRSIGEQRAFIANDVTEKLIAAGRPEEEARAAGQLVAARYVTRAGRFDGKLGSAEELYGREGAAIAGPEGRARPPAQVIREATAAGAQHNEAAHAAHAVAAEAAAKPTEPGIVASDFDTADRVKGEWRKASPFKDTEQFVQASWHNQRALGTAADEIAQAVGVEFKNPGIKARSTEDIAAIKDENKRKKAEFSRNRLENKGKRHGVGGVTDQVRGGFDVQTPAQADQVVAELAKRYPVSDEGWQTTVAGYFDRKAYVRFPDGMIGEIQIWPPGMLEAKQRGGHALYEGVRELPSWHPLVPEFNKAQGDVYAPVRAALSDEWKAALGSGGSEPNRLPNASVESITASDASAALTSDHPPSENTQASEGVQKTGSPSQEPDFTSDMFGVPDPNVGPHSEPVNAAIDISEKVNALSPAEQKRELPKYTAAAEQAPRGVDQPAGVFMFDPTALNVDAKRFQFKSGGDEYGVTGALRNVSKWDPAKAQAIIVWEQKDGQLFVADGHQRAGLARRLTEKGGAKGIELPGILYREKDGITSDDIRAMAAVTNIANGSGSAMDGAKVLRARPDLMDGSLPLSVGKGKQAAALARLGDEPFKMVVNEVIPEHYGAVVGELIPNDAARQTAAIKAIARFEPRNADEAAVLTQRVAQAELAKAEEGAQSSMFGDLETAESTAGEEMKIVGRAIADLKKDRSLFARVLANAERIEQTGSHIQREAASGVASDAEIFAKTLTSDAYAAGPIRDELVAAARDLKNGKSSIGEATGRILAALRSQVETHGLNRAGAGARAEPEAREFAQTDQFDFEAGAEGKPQSLIPGVAPVSQRDLIQAAANKPMTAKKPQKEAGGLFGDSMDQKELFQREHVETPEFKEWFGDSKVVDAEGQPLVVYHGTDKPFSKVNMKKGAQGVFWVTSNRAAIESGEIGAAGAGKIMELYASIKKPAGWKEYDQLSLGEIQGRGFDGVILPNKDGTFDAIVFEPTQIKSATRNSGAYDPDNPKIYEQIARGKIRLDEGKRPIITLMKDANASTFVHESGHQYLEELMRDAAHGEAPEGLRVDAQTVRDWLGVEKPADIKTKHHEKFARGFEQYVREGVAPSPELAGVFAKFRNWLLSIYQSIKGLGTEISPEIRGVFDRMLEMEPQRTVIAPERQSPTLLHDIHEAEAATVEPHEAEPAMDRVIAERDRYIEEQPPEIQREIETARVKIQAEDAAATGAATGGEAGGGGGGSGSLEPGGGGPGAGPGGGAGGAEHGEVKPGGGSAGTESSKPVAPDRRAGLGDHASTALAPSPADLFGARESPFTDRAGNIRVENLTTNEDVAQAIRDAAQENNDFIGERRGVITDGQVMELADALGMDARKLNERHVGQAFNAEQIVAARKLLIQSATDVAAAMKKAAAGTDEDVLAYATAKDRHQMIQAQVSGITAEAGRALRAFRTLAGQEETKGIDQFIREATGKTLFQLRQEAQLGLSLDTPQQVSKFMMDAQKRSFGRMILEYWINAILSGPATHATNIIGNSILAAQHFGPETAIAAMLGRAQSAFGREGTRVRLGEIGAAASGAVRGLAPAIGATGEAFSKGASTLLPGEVPKLMEFQPHDMLAARGTLDETTKYSDLVQHSYSAFRGVRDAVQSLGTLLKGGIEGSPLVSPQYSHLGTIPDIQVRGVTVLPIGTVTRLPGRFLATADTFFRSVNYSMAKNAIAYRTAAHEGLTGTEFDARVAELRTNPPETMMEEARGAATSTTLMDRGGQFVQAMNHLTSASVDLPLIGEITPLKFVNPFVNIAGQIINQSIIKRSPVGLLSRELRADLSGKNGNIAQDMAQARMLMGTAVAMAMGGLAAEGLASGSGPKDRDENAMWRLAGNQAHSVKIGNLWYGVNKLGPVGMLMGMAADLYDVAHKAGEGEYAKAAAYFHHALVQNILDQSFMKGPADLIQAIEDPDRYGGRYIRNYLSSFVPNVGAQVARAQDPYSRETRTVIDAIKAKVPGLSQTLMPKRDIWGQEMPNQMALGGKAVTGIYVKAMSEDPVNQAMVKLNVHPGAVDKKIRNIELTPQQYDDYARIAGRTTKMRLDTIVRAPDYQTWPDHIKATVLSETIKQSREAARGMIMMKNPDLVAKAVEYQKKKARGEKVK